MRYVTVLVSLASVPLMLPGCGVDPSQDPSLGNSDDGLSHDETGIDQAWSPGGETAGTDDDSDSGGGDPARENDTEGLLPPPTCSDPDGRDYSVAAAITWTGDYAGAGEDSCVDFAIPDYGAAVRECRGERCSVYELYCDNGAVAWEYVPCPSGCRDGACLPPGGEYE